MKRVVKGLMVGILAMVLVGAAVGCKAEVAPTTPPGEVAREYKTVKIGGPVPLSGAVAYWGISTHEAWVAGAEDINSPAGTSKSKWGPQEGIHVGDDWYKIECIPYDSKTTVADALAATTRLAFQDNCKYMYSQAAASCIGMWEVTEPNEILTSVACWGYIELEGTGAPYSFRSEMSDYEQGFSYVPFMLEYYGEDAMKSAVFLGPDDKDGYDCYYSFHRLMEYYGIEDRGVEYYLWETVDFYPIVTKALATNPDFIVTSPTPPGITAAIVKAAREMGFEGPVASPAASETVTILEVCGEFADDVILPVTLEYGAPERNEYQAELQERFLSRFGHHFYALSGNYSYWVYALAQAFEDAGTVEDTWAVAQALEKVELYDSYVGHTAYRGEGLYGLDRQGVYDCYTTIIEDEEVRLADVRFPELPVGF